MNEHTVERIEIGDVEIEYEWHGPRGERPFVLVHGFTGSRDDWREHLPALGALGPTLALDQRGHGGSTNTGDEAGYTLGTLVADLAAALAGLGIGRCDLLGHSLGGMVALRFALAHPERTASLVLMDTSPEPVRVGTSDNALQAAAHIARTRGMPELARLMRERAPGDPTRPEAVRRTEREMGPDVFWARIEAKLAAMDPAAFSGLAAELARSQSVQSRLGEIGCPTLVLVGEQDLPFLKPSAGMAATIPGAQQAIVPDAAHSPQLENPKLWFEAVRAHLERARA